MTNFKQICLGVAVAGAVAGGGAAMGTAVAYADSDTDTGSSSSSASSTPDRKSLRAQSRVDRVQVRPDTLRRSERLAAAQTARITKDRAADLTRFAPRDAASVEDAATRLPRAVEVKTRAEERVAARALRSFLRELPTPPNPGGQTPAPLAPLTLTGAGTTAVSRQDGLVPEAAVQSTSKPAQRVIVIGVDGVNLSKILEDPAAHQNFIRLMNSGTTSASTIAGHTTISNPSWTTILTGVWDNKSGVVNNIFDPRPYDRWPTVFDQLEGANRGIRTKVIADWDVITDIASAGKYGADDVVLVGQVPGDSDWSKTDARVTEEAVKSILGFDPGYEDVPNFLFTYLVQVDEAGHGYGGDSPEYAAALDRTDENLGAILDAIAAREAATCAAGTCEEWTIIVVTDHGHQPGVGFGHGFQSPRETSTFVIADGPGFGAGQMNLGYTIADITPTVVSLFGIDPTRDADGKPLMDRGDTQVSPDDLQAALAQQIANYGWPDPLTTFTLSVRTVFASIPYFVVQITDSIVDQLNGVVDQDIPVISQLAMVAVIPVQLVGDALFLVTDVIAQIVARLTGAGVIPPSSGSQLWESADPILWPEVSIAV